MDQAGSPFRTIPVYRIECGKGEFRGVADPVVLQKVQTDVDGNFAFPWKDHTRACLKIQTPGMNPLQVEVTYAQTAGKLKLILSVAN